MLEQIKCSLDKGNVVSAVFLDLKKAFDTVDHCILLQKLQQFQVSNAALLYFKSYLKSREQCVKVGTVKFNLSPKDLGVHSGQICFYREGEPLFMVNGHHSKLLREMT